MGCDIHMQVEVRRGGKWERVHELPPRKCGWCGGKGHYASRPSTEKCYGCSGVGQTTEPYGDRNYTVFAVLANVRNDGHVVPIAAARGLPPEIRVDDGGRELGAPAVGDPRFASVHVEAGVIPDQESEEDDDRVWFGDHSWSWLLLSECLAYDWDQVREDEGWVDLPTFQAWQEAGMKGSPKTWSGGVSGGMVVHVSNDEMRRRIALPRPEDAEDHPYTQIKWAETVRDYCSNFLEFLDTLKTLGAPEDVRLVFGFDS